MDRRRFFSQGLVELFGDLLHNSPLGGVVDRQLLSLSNLLSPVGLAGMAPAGSQTLKAAYPRPPGAHPDRFEELCTRCGDCMAACPHGTLFQIDKESGPVLDPASIACRLCADYPCIQACPEGALEPLPENALPWFGQAVADQDRCANAPRNRTKRRAPRCRACQDACPVPEAVRYDRRGLPTITDACIGCGQCVEVCPPYPVAIRIE